MSLWSFNNVSNNEISSRGYNSKRQSLIASSVIFFVKSIFDNDWPSGKPINPKIFICLFFLDLDQSNERFIILLMIKIEIRFAD